MRNKTRETEVRSIFFLWIRSDPKEANDKIAAGFSGARISAWNQNNENHKFLNVSVKSPGLSVSFPQVPELTTQPEIINNFNFNVFFWQTST